MLNSSQWQGAAPVFVLVKQAYEAIAPVYLRSEFALPEKRKSQSTAAEISEPGEPAPAERPPSPSEPTPGGR